MPDLTLFEKESLKIGRIVASVASILYWYGWQRGESIWHQLIFSFVAYAIFATLSSMIVHLLRSWKSNGDIDSDQSAE